MRLSTKTIRAALLGATLLAAAAAPALAATWIPGHHNPAGYWVPGHWVGGPGVWVVGHVDSYGHWIPGHWAGGFGPAPGVYEGRPARRPMATIGSAGFTAPAASGTAATGRLINTQSAPN